MIPAFGFAHGFFLGIQNGPSAVASPGYWNKKLGILALSALAAFISTLTILPFAPGAWETAPAVPAMTIISGFLLKDSSAGRVILLLRQTSEVSAKEIRSRAN